MRRAGGDARGTARGTVRRASDVENASEDVATHERAVAMDNAAGTTPGEVFSLAGGEVPFWANMVKYARFSISIMVGFAYMFGRPVVGLLKKPQTAALVVAAGAGGYFFFKFTIESMLGVNDPSTFS